MTLKPLRKPLLLLLLVALCAVLYWLWFDWMKAQGGATTTPAELRKVLLPQPKTLPDFRLITSDGAPFGPPQLRHKWTFLFFGYTHCPDVCPTTLLMFKQVHAQLAAAPAIERDTRFLFVSLDPYRDTPAVLKGYIRYFDPSFLAATGDTHVIDHLTDALGTPYAIEDGPTPDDYIVNHSAAVVLIDPQGRYYARFADAGSAAAITRHYRQIRDYYQQTE